MKPRIVVPATPVLLAAIAVTLALLLGWAQHAGQRAAAAGSTPDLAISIDVGGGGDDCDTRASTAGIGTKCNVTVGSMFTVKGHVDSFTGISGTGGYGGIRFRFNHSSGLTLKNRSAETELGPSGSPYWPDCSSRSETKPTGGYQAECHTAGPTSMFLGRVVEVDYNCTMSGTRTITMEDANTFLFNSAHAIDNSDKEGDEVLTINCVAPVGGIAELADVDDTTPLAQPDSSDSNAGVMAAIAAGAAAVLGALGGAVVYARRRWLR